MKLSMWTLFGWLEKSGLRPRAEIAGGLPEISRVRPKRPNAPDPACAELSPAGGLSGGEGYAVALTNGGDTVFVPDAELAEVQDRIAEALEFYNGWEREMLLCLAGGGTLQALLEIAHKVFDRPMFIKSDSSWVFAITPASAPGVHPDWERLVESAANREANFDAVRAVSLDPEFQEVFLQKYPAVVRSPFYGGPVMHANIRQNQRRIGEIVVLEHGKPFNPGEVHLMQVLAGLVETYLLNNPALCLSYANLAGFFTDLIEKRAWDPMNLPAVYRATGWKASDELIVIAISCATKCDTPILGVLRERLTEQMKNACAFSYHNQLLCIAGVNRDRSYESALRRAAELIPAETFTWGVSYAFPDIRTTPAYYQQACMALREAVATGRPYATAYQVACSCISAEIKKLEDLEPYVHPDLRRLIELDRSGNTQYVRTLFEFLLCGGNYTDTASRLGLHRNSLIYRVSRIRALTDGNLDDPENRKLLLYSYLISGVN